MTSMGAAIPADWDGDTYRCVQITWPDSPAWTAVLMGLLSMPGRGRFWDERTGSVIAVRDIGRALFDANLPLASCDGEPVTPPPIEKHIYYFDTEGEDEDEMGCAPCIRWNAGVLEVLVCGEWSPVPGGGAGDNPISTPEGDDIGDPTIPQPNDSDTVDIDVKCRAAYALAKAMWRVHARIIDYVDDVFAVLDIGNKVAADLPEYTLTKYHISMSAATVIFATATVDLDIMFGVETTYIADLAAWFMKFMPTRYSLNRLQYEAVAVGLLAYSFHEGVEINIGQFVEGDYWRQIWWALGPGTVNDIMAASRTLDDDEFECEERPVYYDPPPVPPVDGGPWFSGLITKTDGHGALAITGMSSNMRRIDVRWMIDAPGEQYTAVEYLASMVCPANLTTLVLRFRGDYPVKNWHSLPYNRWDDPLMPKLVGVAESEPSVLGTHTAEYADWTIYLVSGKPTGYEQPDVSSARALPGDTRALGQTTTFSVEIVSWS